MGPMVNRWFPLGFALGSLLGYIVSLPHWTPDYFQEITSGLLCVVGVSGYVAMFEGDVRSERRWLFLGLSIGSAFGYLASLPGHLEFFQEVTTGVLVAFGVLGYVARSEMGK